MTSSKTCFAMLLIFSAIAVARGESRTNAWQMQVGYVHQWGRGMSVSGPAPSVSVGDLASAPLGGRILHSGLPTPTYPDNSLLIPRTFNDGYVLPDLWTSDPGLIGTERYGMTWNWSADNPSLQYNYDSGIHPTLAFHISDQQAVVGATTVSGTTSDDNMPTEGVEIKFSRNLWSWTNADLAWGGSGLTWTNGNASLDVVLGLAWFPEVHQHTARQASLSVYNVTETYTYFDYYGTSEGPLFSPSFPSYAGTFDGPGPLIPGNPESWTSALNPLGTARDNVSIDSSIWHVRGELGLTLTKEITQRLSVYASPQFVMEFVDMHAYRSETLTYTDTQPGGTTTTLASHADSKHKETLVPGFMLTGGANYLLTQNWFVGASVGWEWLARDPSINVGPDRVRFDLGGGECSLYLGRRF